MKGKRQSHRTLLFPNTSLSEKTFSRDKFQRSKEHSSRHSPNSRTRLPFPESCANSTWGSAQVATPQGVPGYLTLITSRGLIFQHVASPACASLQESILPGNIHDGFVKQLMDDNQRPFQTRELEGKKQQRLMKRMKTTLCTQLS